MCFMNSALQDSNNIKYSFLIIIKNTDIWKKYFTKANYIIEAMALV